MKRKCQSGAQMRAKKKRRLEDDKKMSTCMQNFVTKVSF